MQHFATQQQVNHVTENSAYHVHNYPYSFGRFCTIRYWVETRKAYGQRLMTQIMDPTTGQWFKAKTDGYFDICIITSIVNPGQPNHGWVVPIQVKLAHLSLENLTLFSTYYTFTPHQKQAVMDALRKHSIYQSPKWDERLELDYYLVASTENPHRTLAQRLTNDVGIPIETQEEADKRYKRERRLNQPAELAKAQASERKFVTIAGERIEVTGMSEEQIQEMRELNGE